jgi:hypothetical protein
MDLITDATLQRAEIRRLEKENESLRNALKEMNTNNGQLHGESRTT